MKVLEIRNLIRQVISEVKDEKIKKENSLPKSGGKLVELKKELEGLRRMKESISQFSINESNTEPITVEYAHMQKFVNEINKIKEAHSRLSEMLDNQISEVESRMTSETQKIKEMIGLVQPSTKNEEKTKKNLKNNKPSLLDLANEYVAKNGDTTPEDLSKKLNISLEKAKGLIKQLSVNEDKKKA